MRKLIITTLLLILGTISFATSGKAIVTVRAEIISEELVVGGVNNKPLIIDFGKNNNSGKLDFMVQYAGVKNTADSISQIKFDLASSEVKLINEKTSSILTSSVKLNKDEEILNNKDSEVIGSIQGNIEEINSNMVKGIYAGITQLNITVIPM